MSHRRYSDKNVYWIRHAIDHRIVFFIIFTMIVSVHVIHGPSKLNTQALCDTYRSLVFTHTQTQTRRVCVCVCMGALLQLALFCQHRDTFAIFRHLQSGEATTTGPI